MNERDDVLAIIDKLELEDYFEIHGVETVKYKGKRAVAILVEVRDE